MYWTIDIGNTEWKTGIFHRNKLVESLRFPRDKAIEQWRHLEKQYPVTRGIFSSVSRLTPEEKAFFTEDKWLRLTPELKFNFTNLYATPQTLGADRLALAAAAVAGFPGKQVLVIDAGTCLTYEYVSAATYYGGAISPGIKSRYRALHDYTANLPLLKKQVPENFLGKDTPSSIHSGVINGLVQEIEGVINQYKNKHSTELIVVLTGGDADFLANLLKSSIFVRPNFLLYGLYSILKTNNS